MPLGVYNEIRYTIRGRGSSVRAVGYQIGRFAIRKILNGDELSFASERLEFPFYSVDHIPTGYAVMSAQTVEEAAQIADDMSRFSEKDPSSKNPHKAIAQMGRSVDVWRKAQVKRIAGGAAPQSYREFYADEQQGR
jgi:hypothetical protein